MKTKRVLKKKDVREMIDNAGTLQAAVAEAASLYKKQREELARPLELLFGTDQYVHGSKGVYQAALLFDSYSEIDPLAVVNKYNRGKISKVVLRKILSVKLAEARKLLGDAMKKELLVTSKEDTPTLHIGKCEQEE